jgi:hypothetical protein
MDAATLMPPPSETILIWFKEEWPGKRRYPDLSQCALIRDRLGTVARAEQRRAPTPRLPASAALKSARALLRQLAKLRCAIRAEADAYELHLDDWAQCQIALAALDQAEPHIQDVKKALPKPRQPNPARYIGDGVRNAWYGISDRIALSVGEDRPMTRFVCRALASIGFDYSQTGIIAALKHKRLLSERKGRPDRRQT